MVTFMLQGRYSSSGVHGSLAEGFEQRTEYFRQLIALYEGSITAVYWPEHAREADVIALIEMPDAIAMKAVELAVNQSEAVHVSYSRLLSVQEMDEARAKLPLYRAPGEAPPPMVR